MLDDKELTRLNRQISADMAMLIALVPATIVLGIILIFVLWP